MKVKEFIRFNVVPEETLRLLFGTFLLKKRAKKIGRNISKKTAIIIPAHMIPAFKPAKEFSAKIKSKVKVK